jgi:DNA adenine methylase
MSLSIKPIIKWAGGKRSIMKSLLDNFPDEFNDYHEPFAGGLSVCIELFNTQKLKDKKVFIADFMQPLINLYNVVKLSCVDLIVELKKKEYANNLTSFTEKRELFNTYKLQDEVVDPICYAALFVYLNRTCFNGMYRENGKGLYNIPFGKQVNPTICNEESLIRFAEMLNTNDVYLSCCDYSATLQNMKQGDFVYMDPPYYGTFTGYNKDGFGEQQQKELKETFDNLTAKGCKVALSNSNSEFIRDLYKDYKQVVINVKRVINSKADNRKDTKTELLILNY